MRYLHIDDDRLVVRPSERDLIARGAAFLFVVSPIIAALGWLAFGLLGDADSRLALLVASSVIGLACAAPALYGLIGMGTARRRAAARAVVIDVGERLVTLPGRAAEVFRTPERVRISGTGLTWTLSLEDQGARTVLVRGVLRGSGRDLAAAADALAEQLEVDAHVPAAARGARGMVPADLDFWAALAYAPLDGVNLAYPLFALMSAREPRLRFAAKQSLALLAVEGLLALMLCGCIGLPLALVSLPAPLEVAALLLPLLVLGAVRLGVRVYAAFAAHRGRVWVIPVLGLLTRRWAPAEVRPRPAAHEKSPAGPASKASRATPVGDPFSAEREG